MAWLTRKHVHVNRTATAWLIRRFLDRDAEILFVEPEEVAPIERSTGAIGISPRDLLRESGQIMCSPYTDPSVGLTAGRPEG
ncbi:MAG TPA: chromate resistance protein ChrB domain-containing protein [Vicinamibacteria bacterium]|nr:chromate resistance protein ChrB domain-containing protein [Vicinamibacteria bacterium]